MSSIRWIIIIYSLRLMACNITDSLSDRYPYFISLFSYMIFFNLYFFPPTTKNFARDRVEILYYDFFLFFLTYSNISMTWSISKGKMNIHWVRLYFSFLARTLDLPRVTPCKPFSSGSICSGFFVPFKFGLFIITFHWLID